MASMAKLHGWQAWNSICGKHGLANWAAPIGQHHPVVRMSLWARYKAPRWVLDIFNPVRSIQRTLSRMENGIWFSESKVNPQRWFRQGDHAKAVGHGVQCLHDSRKLLQLSAHVGVALASAEVFKGPDVRMHPPKTMTVGMSTSEHVSMMTSMSTWSHGHVKSTWSHGHIASCQHGVMATWHHVNMESWPRYVDMESWPHGIMSTWSHGHVKSTWSHVHIASCQHGVLATWHHVNMESWPRYVDMESWPHGIMSTWNHHNNWLHGNMETWQPDQPCYGMQSVTNPCQSCHDMWMGRPGCHPRM